MEEKKHIRELALSRRDRLTAQERLQKSEKITEFLCTTAEYKECEILLCYLSFRSEVCTDGLIERAREDGKKIGCPRVEGKQMNFYFVEHSTQLQKGCMGIWEPDPQQCVLCEPRKEECILVVMPGCAFDLHRNRIGYGGGYYDRYLEQYSFLQTIGIFYDCQMEERIPAMLYDRKPNKIITEKRILSMK